MTRTSPPPPRLRQKQNFDLERFKVRLTARLCVVYIAVTQIALRLFLAFAEPGLSKQSKITFFISTVFMAGAAFVVCFEYFLFKRLGPKIVRYSFLVDLALLTIFTAEWLTTMISSLSRVNTSTDPPSFGISAVLGFTTFSWRTIFQTFIVQNWFLKILSPVSVLSVIIGYNIYYDSSKLVYILLRGGFQIINVMLLFYFEDKIKLKMILANMHQEKWMQINQFILNSVPENILILDLAGQPKFISDYFKYFMEKCRCSLNINEFFTKVQDLQQQLDLNSTSLSIIDEGQDRLNNSGIHHQSESNKTINLSSADSLDQLLTSFQNSVKAKYFREKAFLIYNGKLKVPNRSDRSIEVKLSFIQQQDNEYIILIVRDTTQRDKLVALEDNNKYKDQLLASVSHELRAPLNGTINLVEAAIQAKGTIPTENLNENFLVPAVRSSKFLLHLINDILDMSQIKAKKLRLTFQPGSLIETLKDTIQLVELQAKKKKINLEMQADSELPESFWTDHVRLSQIVLNLLNNAIKFTKEGVIKLTAATMENNSHWVKITVEDSGIGMTRENVKRLFSSYTHIDFKGREQINPTGVGLGLNIAYNLAELLGPADHNEIKVTSIPNQGSTFNFILENKEVKPTTIAVSQAASDGSLLLIADEKNTKIKGELSLYQKMNSCYSTKSLKKSPEVSPIREKETECSCPKILIVDDNPFNIMAFETILSSLEIKNESVFNGKEAIDKLMEKGNESCGENCQGYSVVFMDQEMPGMSGSDTVMEIKRLQELNLLPEMKIIGCTGHGAKEEIDNFMESGIDECIQKPISLNKIKELLDEFLV